MSESVNTSPVTSAMPLELIDIEQPLKPGIDWLGWLEWGMGLLLVALLLLGLLWLGRQFWPSAFVRWRLSRLQQASQSMQEMDVDVLKLRLYELFKQAQQKSLLMPDKADALKSLVERMSFGPQRVSRETLNESIAHFETSLLPIQVIAQQNGLRIWHRVQASLRGLR
jgi:hypothetical protein